MSAVLVQAAMVANAQIRAIEHWIGYGSRAVGFGKKVTQSVESVSVFLYRIARSPVVGVPPARVQSMSCLARKPRGVVLRR